MDKIWQTKEFKEAKEKAIEEGKWSEKCEWCDSVNDLCLHHEETHTDMIKMYIAMLVLEKIYLNTKKIPKTLNSETIQSYVEEYPQIEEKAKELAKEKYCSLQGTVMLCKRCHHAWHMGRILCPYCKEKYYYPKQYSSCVNCKDKIEDEEWREKRELYAKITKKNELFREKIKKYPFAYQKWSKDEERILTNLFRKKIPYEEIAKILKRQPSAIVARLKKLNMVDQSTNGPADYTCELEGF